MAGHRRGGGNPGSQQARAAPSDRVAHRRATVRPGQCRSPHARHRPARLPGAIPANGPEPSGGLVQRPASLAALRAYPTDRQFPVHDAEEYGYLLGATYRRPVPGDCVPALGTEHIDLNWQNITAPRFCILDMEHWCSAVTGYGAAYLYLTALEVPAVAGQVREVLADELNTPSGRYAQLVAAGLILRNLTRLPDPGHLAARLHAYTDTLLA